MGDDVFFLTTERLTRQDVDTVLDLYDAHVCTDSPCITFPNVQSPSCTNEASCKASPSPQPSIFGESSSATFSRPGNLIPVAKPKPLTWTQKLDKALKACHKRKGRHKRVSCERHAHKRFGHTKKRR